MSGEAMPRMMRMILPFRRAITSVDGTWKLNRNKPDEVRVRAADHLAARADPGALAIAALMRQVQPALLQRRQGRRRHPAQRRAVLGNPGKAIALFNPVDAKEYARVDRLDH